MKRKLVLFATFWNEIDWIKTSLMQLDALEPDEIIICDGCFDPKFINKSTDGTREVIEEFVAKRANARMISALRLSRLKHICNWFKVLPHESEPAITIAKMNALRHFLRKNIYRLNQAATFNYMIEISDAFRKGNWFMTYDCDQFYSDEMIISMREYIKDEDINILVGKELTFFGSFDQYTDSYENRDYNNMPHRIFEDSRFIPTRLPCRPFKNDYLVCSDFLKGKKNIGYMYHYHVKSPSRLSQSYEVGNRKPPEASRVTTETFNGNHPKIIQNVFLK